MAITPERHARLKEIMESPDYFNVDTPEGGDISDIAQELWRDVQELRAEVATGDAAMGASRKAWMNDRGTRQCKGCASCKWRPVCPHA